MGNDFDGKLEIDRKKLRNAVRLQTPIEITTYTLPRNMEIYIRSIMTTFLEECHQEHLQEYLSFCLGELLTNAKKANTKRVYFKEKGLDINDPDDYKKGMESCKEDTLTNIDHYLELQKKDGLYIKLDLQLRGDKVKIEIRNKAVLTSFEKERIQSKLDSVQKYNSMEEVLTNVIDQTEGAGLGIIIIILMLQKVGLAKENYQVESVGGETITRIILPCNREIFESEENLTNEFLSLQTTIPVIKENYEQIKSALNKDDYSPEEALNIIREDVTLSLLLLKEALKKDKEIAKINHAFSLFDCEELKKLYSDENSTIRVVEKTEKNEYLWEHAKKTAFIAFNLVKNNPNLEEKYNADELYTSGLLNALGFIFLENATQAQKDKLEELTENDKLKDKIRDVFWNGNAHTYLNLIYSKRLGFSDSFASRISSWNYWEMVPENLLDSSYIVYLAEMIQYYAEGLIEFYQVDKNVLEFFKITSETQFRLLAKKFNPLLH